MKILESYEFFLLDIIYQDNDYDKSEDPKILLKKFIDRFQFLMQKQTELVSQKKEAEISRELLLKSQQEESNNIQNTILKLNGEIRKTSSSIEQLKIEDSVLQEKLTNTIETYNSKFKRTSK